MLAQPTPVASKRCGYPQGMNYCGAGGAPLPALRSTGACLGCACFGCGAVFGRRGGVRAGGAEPVLSGWAAGLAGGSYRGAFLLGATSGLVAAPCTAPAFAAVLTFVAATGSGWRGFAYLLVFSLGLTTLLVAVGISSAALAALPKAGAWTQWIRRAAGVLLLVMAEYYFVRTGSVL